MTFSFYFDIIEGEKIEKEVVTLVILNTNWVTKLVALVEDNPLVKGFGDVEVVLTSLFGKENFTIKGESNEFLKVQLVDIDNKTELLAPFSKTYEVSVDKEVFGILVENWGSNTSPEFLVKLLFNETSQTYNTTLL